MKVPILAATAAVAAWSVAVAQPAPAPAPQQCFSSRQIDNSVVVDDSTINFKVGTRTYQAKMIGACPRLKDSFGGYTLVFRGSDQICGPLDLQLSVNDVAGGACIAESLRQLTPAETAALPLKEKP